MSQPIPDAKTTPRWLQLPGLLLLLLLSVYYFTAYASVYSDSTPTIVQNNPYTFWFGTWKMFTKQERYHSSLEASVLVDDEWEPMDLEALFPYRWESGPRYARGVFRKHGTRMRTLANATCSRYENAHGRRPRQLNLYQVRWRKTLGSGEQPRGEENREERRPLMMWSCERDFSLPQGTVR